MTDAARAQDDAIIAILKERDWSRVGLAREVHALREQTAGLRAALRHLGQAIEAWIKIRKGLHRAGMEPTPTEMDVWAAFAEVHALLADPEGQRARQEPRG